jgi:serine/threonine protein kinase/tetratricopeptide (TPR) repeat protein
MGRGPSAADLAELDAFVEAYESKRSADPGADLATFLPSPEHPLYLQVLCELVRLDQEYGWRGGQPHRLEDYQQRFPVLFRNDEHLRSIAFEEYRQRRQLGEDVPASDYERAWGVDVEDWPVVRASTAARSPSGVQPILNSGTRQSPGGRSRTDVVFPQAGETILDFNLIAELGRGAFGRVYLARQQGAFDRQVVLKVATNISMEARNLVQLQHTNIIPVYSVHQFGSLHALCMPFLGATTLADILKSLRERDVLPHSGKELVDTATACLGWTRQQFVERGVPVDGRRASDSGDAAIPAPIYWNHLDRLTYVRAVVWLAVRLAGGLAHAHERGILHRDLKPANILLTEEGRPMLLDFNLSEDIKPEAGVPASFVGGTLPYLAPEQLRALQGSGAPADARGDVYSLGVIVYELLSGRLPFPVRAGPIEQVLAEMTRDRDGRPPRLRRWNRAVSPAVESIVRHCMEPDPARRYQSARQLQEDLQLHLDHRPLVHAPEASRAERTAKWIQRHPRLALSAVACSVFLFFGGLAWSVAARNEREARGDAAAGSEQFHAEVRQARMLLTTSLLSDRERLDEGAALANGALDRYRVCEDSRWWNAPAVRWLPPNERQSLREEAGDIALLLASITAMNARNDTGARRVEALRAAQQLNRAGEWSYPAGRAPALLHRQDIVLRRLAAPDTALDAPPDQEESADSDSKSTKDLAFDAVDLMHRNHFVEALPLWRSAARRAPADVWMWAGQAACYENLARPDEAAACYSTCIALAPDLNWLYFKRGVAFLHAEEYDSARYDFDQFLTNRPDVPEAYINRALTREGLEEYDLALRDISKAIVLGTNETRVYFIRSLLRERTGDRNGAREDDERGMRLDPTDELSCVVRGLARAKSDPNAALADFDRALRFNPRSLNALRNKANLLAEQLAHLEQSVSILDRAIDLYPWFVPARLDRGLLLARLKRRAPAVRDAADCLRQNHEPETLYRVARIYSLTSEQEPQDRDEALYLLASALRKGYGRDMMATDKYLDPIRWHPEFVRLVKEGATAAKPAKSGLARP